MKPTRCFRPFFVVLTIVLAAVVGIFWFILPGTRHRDPATAKKPLREGDTALAGEPVASETRERPIRDGEVNSEERWSIGSDADQVSIALALDEAMLRDKDGVETLVRLEPPATMRTLSTRLAELKAEGGVFPVAYPEGEERSEVNRYIVTKDLRVQIPEGDADRIAAENRLVVIERPEYAPDWVVMAASGPLAALEAMPRLREYGAVASADVLLAARQFKRAAPNDPLYGQQWHLKKTELSAEGTDVNIESLWNWGGQGGGLRGSGIRIGIVDDGLQTTHPDFFGGVDTINDYDFNGVDEDPTPTSDDGHGTACGGVAAGRGNNGIGISGAAPMATLVGYRLIAGQPTDSQIARALNYKNEIVPIKNNSWGPSDGGNRLGPTGPLTAAALRNSVTRGRDGKGTIFVWAAGNGGHLGDNANYDAYGNSIYTIAVAAMNNQGTQSYYSEPGSNLAVCAPSSGNASQLGITTTDLTGTAGYNEVSSSQGGDYTNDFGGTSSATPLVSGVIALILEKNPELGWRDVQEILMRSAAKIDANDSDWVVNGAGFNFNHKYGAGRVDAAAAVALADGWTNLPPQVSTTVSNANLPVAIPENDPAGITRTFVVSGAETRVEHVTVEVSIGHSARGDLAVTLISPSGVESRLAERHGDTNADYPNWTFSTVRDWGEDADGTWTLRVADVSGEGNGNGGTLTLARLTVYGSSTAPPNPAPEVDIVGLESGQIFDSGTEIQMEVTASDLDVEGNPGTITKVELIDNGTVVRTATEPPYVFTLTPADGDHAIEAKAYDALNLAGSSDQVVVSFGNQTPVVTNVALSRTSQCYADETLEIIGVTASDHETEAGALEISYQWQSSTDGISFTDAVDAVFAALPTEASNAAKTWRCQVTASDGEKTSEPFITPGVNILPRPVLAADPGDAYQYASGLVLRGSQMPLNRRAIISEFSQGAPSGGNAEWVEILMLKSGSLANCRVVGKYNSPIIFANSAAVNNLPAGTLIVIYNGNSSTGKDPALPADDADPSDGRLVISSLNRNFFSDLSEAWIFLDDSNSGDAVILQDENLDVIHSLSYGGNRLSPLVLPAVGAGKSAYFAGASEEAADLAEQWTVTTNTARVPATPLVGVTPAAPNTDANAVFVNQLRTGTYLQPPLYRIGQGGSLPAGLVLAPETGVISGTIDPEATQGVYRVIIERYNADGETVSQSFDLRVGVVPGFESWIAGYEGLEDDTASGDADSDGLANVLEYLLGLDPGVAEAAAPVFEAETDGISLVVSTTPRPDFELRAQWSATLGADAEWSSEGIETVSTPLDGGNVELRFTLPVSSEYPKRFLRLIATPVVAD